MLSIIRLRSEELAQHEVAYYFAALALGLLSGLSTGPTVLLAALMAVSWSPCGRATTRGCSAQPPPASCSSTAPDRRARADRRTSSERSATGGTT